MESELKNCPYCGGKPSLIPHIHNKNHYEVRCINESCYEGHYSHTPEEAAERWNTRAKDPEKEALIADLQLLKIAIGMHVNADAYSSTFPDNADDDKYLKKQETYLRLSARNLIPESLSWECHEAFKNHSEPELLEKLKELKLW